MNDCVRKTLCDIITTYGRDVCEETARCRGLLNDLCPHFRKEIHVLVSAQEEQIPRELLVSHSSLPWSALSGKLVKKLVDNRALTPEASQWAVDSWALALGVVSSQLIAQPSVQSPGSIQVRCPHCRGVIRIPKDQLNQPIQCLVCRGYLRVPSAETGTHVAAPRVSPISTTSMAEWAKELAQEQSRQEELRQQKERSRQEELRRKERERKQRSPPEAAKVIRCPACARKLRVPNALVGILVKCTACGEQFTVPDTQAPPSQPPSAAESPSHTSKVGHGGNGDEDDDRPRRRRSRYNRDDEDDDPSPRRCDLVPHRGETVMWLGLAGLILTFVVPVVALVFAIPAWVMGNNDLAEMRVGRMERGGQSHTSMGRVCGMIAVILHLIGAVLASPIFCCMCAGLGRGGRR